MPRKALVLGLLSVLLGPIPAAPLWAVAVTVGLDPSAGVGTIDPLSYGANHLDVLRVNLRRVGGNRMTGYNWENNASNAGADYFHQSDYYLLGQVGLPQNGSQAPAAVPVNYVQQFRAGGSKGEIVTLQTAGYVSADASGPVAVTETAPSPRWKQVLPHKPGWPGSLLLAPNKADGVVYIDEQVNYLVNKFGPASAGGIKFYALDNEWGIWNSTHPRIHPNAPTYAETYARASATAAAVLDIDPSAQIFAPAAYGWGEYADMQGASDAGTYNPTYGWYLSYLLDKMKQASSVAGKRLLHYLDVHWYPEAVDSNGIRIDQGNPDRTDQAGSMARMQAPRSLWDPTYTENSWIATWATSGPIALIPRLQASVDTWYPGTKLSISEYDYGAPDHVSGGIAQADVLGILGRYGVVGCRWGAVLPTSYVQSAFDLYLNYDGAGAQFGDLSFSATTSDVATLTVYGAKSSADPYLLTVMALNKDYSNPTPSAFNLTLGPGQSIQSISVRRFDSSSAVIASPAAPAFAASSFGDTLPPMSATLYIVRLQGTGTATATRTATPAPTPTATPSATRTLTATRTSTYTLSPTPSITPSVTPTLLPTLTCPRNVFVFMPYWSLGSLPPASIPWDRVTHIAEAFIRPLADGSLEVPPGYLDPTLPAQAHAHGRKVLASAGGAGSGVGGGSEFWAAMAGSPVARANFVDQAYNFLLANNFDGIDLDWEFPSNAADKAALTATVAALRAKFNSSPAPAPSWLITADVSWGSYYAQWWDLSALSNTLDYFNIMAYDMYGTWTAVSGHNGALKDSTLPGALAGFNGDDSITWFVAHGAPASKLQYGLADYGARFNSPDLYQGCAAGDCSSTSLPYSAIVPLIGAGWTRVWDASASSPYLKNTAGTQVISYDDPQSIDLKARWTLYNRGVAGVMAWELSQDDASANFPLTTAMWNAAQCVYPTATPTATRTLTPSPTVSPSFTSSPTLAGTCTATPTISQTFTQSPTFSISPTLTLSPTFTATVTATPNAAASNGPLGVDSAVALPDPDPVWLKVKLSGPADRVRLRIFSQAYVLVGTYESGPLPGGWDQLPLAAAAVGLPNGLYFVMVDAFRGSEKSPKPARALFYRAK